MNLIRKKDFFNNSVVFFLGSQFISLIGSSVVDYVLIWFITLKTHSGLMMSTSILVDFLPKISISMVAGNWIDQHSKKLLIGLSDGFIALFSAILAIIFLINKATMPIILFVMFCRAVGTGLQTPCEKAIIAEVASDDELIKVNSINAATLAFANLIAPALGGLLLSYISISAALIVDLLTAAIAISFLPFIKCLKSQHEQRDHSNTVSFLLQTLKNVNPQFKSILSLSTLFTFLIVPVTYLIPLLVVDVFGNKIWRLTLLEVFYGIGAMLGGIYLAKHNSKEKYRMLIEIAISSVGIATVVLGLVKIYFWIFLIAIFVAAIFIVEVQSLIVTLIQKRLNPQTYGKGFACLEISTDVALPVGIFIFGLIEDLISPSLTFIFVGFATIFLGIAPFIKRINKRGKYSEHNNDKLI